MYNRYFPYQYYHSNKTLPYQTNHIVSNTPLHPPECYKTAKNNFNFKSLKKNTYNSLNEVESFLNNFCCTWKYIRLINLLK